VGIASAVRGDLSDGKRYVFNRRLCNRQSESVAHLQGNKLAIIIEHIAQSRLGGNEHVAAELRSIGETDINKYRRFGDGTWIRIVPHGSATSVLFERSSTLSQRELPQDDGMRTLVTEAVTPVRQVAAQPRQPLRGF